MTTDINATGTLPTDDEMDLLTDYLGGYLSEEDHQSFDRRLEEDEDFFYRMAPMLDFWYSPHVLPAEMEALCELRAERPALEPAGHSGFRRAAEAWWHRQWRQLGTLAAATTVLCVVLIRALSSPKVIPMVATHAIPRPHTPHRVVAAAPAPTVRRRSVAARPAVPDRRIADRAIEEALVASVTRALPETRSAAVGAVAATDVQATPITALEVPSQLPDSTAQNAEERARDLTAPKVPAGQGVVSGGFWQWFRDKVRGIKKPIHPKF